MPAAREIAGDLLFAHDSLYAINRFHRGPIHLLGQFAPHFCPQVRHAQL